MKIKRSLTALLIGAIIILAIRWTRQGNEPTVVTLSGTTMGPIPYSIKYLHSEGINFQLEIDSILVGFNQSLSTYIPNSEISTFNNEDSLLYQSNYFFPVLERSRAVYESTGGAFDPTVAPLVNAWGFGPGKEQQLLDTAAVNSLLKNVGFEKIQFDDKVARKLNEGIKIDFSAIAKGYGVDVVADYLESQGVNNYMVEIGGEVRCRGISQRGDVWRIGIEDPTNMMEGQKLHSTVYLKDRSMATSGNYRNFYVQNGRKISHTISPFTGFPVEHSLLSASVFAKDCMTADAYATAFMVLGVEKSLEIVKQTDRLDVFLIYSNEEGTLVTYASEGIKNFIETQ